VVPVAVVLLVAVVALGSLAVVVARTSGEAGPAARATPPVADARLVADRPEVRAAALVRAWDARREAAWARGDEAALVGLYSAGSSAARADRSQLRAWSARGLRLHGVSTQLLGLRVLDHEPGRWELVVVDRLRGVRVVPVGAVAGSAASAGRVLPRDGPQASRVVLVRRPGAGWVVDVLAPAAPGEAAGVTGPRAY
jgi:hypothetical protein